MEWDIIFNLIDPKLFVVVVVCWCVGYMLKLTPRIPEWTIIYLITVVAVLLAIWLIGLTAEAVIQGILCGSFAVYGHQFVKQGIKRECSKRGEPRSRK